TETYITKNLNGKVISQKLLSRDTYSAMSNIVIRGKGKVKEVIPEKKEEEEKPAEKPTEKPIEKPVNET
ncbi:hypothetical protein, partial [Brevundimonas sp.]|uniref:hypothetical protein n=1 Tax=Brevundimonas sp. TaxID=1871086 RepID=UPI002FCA2B25